MKNESKTVPSVQDVREALKDVIDPELNVNLVDLGLIYNIDIKDDGIYVEMTLTTPGCPMSGVLPTAVENKVQSVALGSGLSVEVNLVWEPSWTPELISEEGKRSLGIT